MARLVATALIVIFAVALIASLPPRVSPAQSDSGPRARIKISVMDLGTGQPIKPGQTLTALTSFQVTVTTDGIDCAGQYVVTALGAASAPPSVMVQPVWFLIGPAMGTNSWTGAPLNSTLQNTWKISASCNSVQRNGFDFASFEFFADVP